MRSSVAEADLGRIVDDPHRLGVAGQAGADDLVMRRRRRPAGIARGDALDAGNMLEDAFEAPEAAAGEDGDGGRVGGGQV